MYHDQILNSKYIPGGGGGTDLERGYGDVQPWRPPFSENFEILASTA